MSEDYQKKAICKPCSDKEYFSMKAISRTTLMSVANGKDLHSDGGLGLKSHVMLGTLVHAMLFQGDDYLSSTYVVHSIDGSDPDYRKKEHQESRDILELETQKIAVKISVAKQANWISSKIKSIKILESVFNETRNDVLFENGLIGYTDWSEGMTIKARADVITNRGILDLKVTHCENLDQFRGHIVNFGYDIQALFLKALWHEASGLNLDVTNLCVNDKDPNIVFTHKYTNQELIHARDKSRMLLGAIKNLTGPKLSIYRELQDCVRADTTNPSDEA